MRRGSLAYRSGLRSGDVIVQAGGKPLVSTADLNRLLGEGTAPVALLVRREGRQVFVALERSS